jgi:hypothetical protein
MRRISRRLILAVTLAAAFIAVGAPPAAADHPDTASRSKLRAVRILERHRQRHEFPPKDHGRSEAVSVASQVG